MSSRDRRFVAVHRGGPLERGSHEMLARWAADCAETVLPLFEKEKNRDLRPRKAIETVRAWARGRETTGTAMKASLAAHAAARAVKDPRAVAAARAAGQAAGSAHCADHCMGALLYMLKIQTLSGKAPGKTLKAQIAKLPRKLRQMVREGVVARGSFFLRHPSRR